MNTTIEFDFLEPPKGKERPRMCFRNGKFIAYTPKTTHSYEKRMGSLVSKLMRKNEWERFGKNIPLECVVHAFYPIPASVNKATKGQMQNGEILPTKAPDADNVMKIIFDALNGVAYEDDEQICNIIFSKTYDSVPKISVKIREIET